MSKHFPAVALLSSKVSLPEISASAEKKKLSSGGFAGDDNDDNNVYGSSSGGLRDMTFDTAARGKS